ncbi:MAG: hypothetical protein GX221_03850 [Candidatus Riflebacteria bacterium]|nr:hypothetical protein [Candidatus Riflebacteria bacterium]
MLKKWFPEDKILMEPLDYVQELAVMLFLLSSMLLPAGALYFIINSFSG